MLNRLKSMLGLNNEQSANNVTSSTPKGSGVNNIVNPAEKVSGQPAQPRRTRTVPKNAKTREEMTIHRQDRVPKHDKILSVEGGEIYLTNNHRKDYVVLRLSADDDRIVIISSLEKAQTPGIDNDFASLLGQCKSRGYRLVARFYAKSQIIQLVYQDGSGGSKDKDEIADPKSYQVAFDAMITTAMQEDISDIHIEVNRENAEVRFRKDGGLVFGDNWTREYAIEMAIVIYQVIAEEKDVTFKMNEPQPAVIVRNINGQQVRVRLNTLPSYPNGFDMILRIFLEGAENHRKISDSGYYPEQMEVLEESSSDPTGVTIVAGTTGSGKSTTVAALLAERIESFTYNDSSSIKVITVEDPPENAIKFTTQVPVVRSKKKEDGESPFSPYIRAAMRADPDVLMVGEVRDRASAELLMSAVQSGHAVITTVHAPSAIGIIARLRSNVMGLPNDVLGSRDFISGLVYQALVPVVCKKCCHSFEEFKQEFSDRKSQQLIERLEKITTAEQQREIIFKNMSGCDDCNQGKKGRIVVAETIRPNDPMKKLFLQGKDFEALQLFYRQGGKPIQYYGFQRILDGTCDPRDIEYKIGRLHADFVFEHELAVVDSKTVDQGAFDGASNANEGEYSFQSKLLGDQNNLAEIKKLSIVKKDNKENNNDDQTTE